MRVLTVAAHPDDETLGAGGTIAWHAERGDTVWVLLLADGAKRLRDGLFGQGVPSEALEEHLSVLGNGEALEAALAWYRSNKGLAADIGTIAVPTLYFWGDADATVGPDAAYGTAEFVQPSFAMEVLPGVGHFVMDQAPVKATDLLLAHLAKHPV